MARACASWTSAAARALLASRCSRYAFVCPRLHSPPPRPTQTHAHPPPPPNQALPPALAAQSACVALDPHPQAVALARRNAAALLGLASEGQYRVVQGRIEEEATMCVCMHACAHVSSFRSVPE